MLSEKQIQAKKCIDELQLALNTLDSTLSTMKKQYDKEFETHINFYQFCSQEWETIVDTERISKAISLGDIPPLPDGMLMPFYSVLYVRNKRNSDLKGDCFIGFIDGQYMFFTGAQNATITRTDSFDVARLMIFDQFKPKNEERSRKIKLMIKLIRFNDAAMALTAEWGSNTEWGSEKYPFNDSFDEVAPKITAWTEQQLALLK
jgi:hypothetical protein